VARLWKIGRLILLLPALALPAACGDGNRVKKNELMQLQAEAARAYAAEDWRAAERYLKLLTERVPGEGEIWFRLGNVYARTHRPDEAVAAYKEALLRQNVKSKSWHNMGIVHLRQADISPEDPLFQRAAALNEAVLNILDQIDGRAGGPAAE
jgi:Flp pilus assembly protein TadD